jgi:hypothetical protein
VTKQAGVKQVDYQVTTHYHADHCGATAALAAQMLILNYVDHGPSVEVGKSDDWWKQRRGPWFRKGMGQEYDQRYNAYLKAREASRHLVVKAGDVVPLEGVELRVLCSGGKILDKALPDAGQENPACADVERRADDDAEDAQSIGVLVTLGKFRFVYLGDLTWNLEHALFCPVNKVGTVDAYLVTHHAQSFAMDMGAYYHGLSACPKSEVHGLRPRVAILSPKLGVIFPGKALLVKELSAFPISAFWLQVYESQRLSLQRVRFAQLPERGIGRLADLHRIARLRPQMGQQAGQTMGR